MQAVLEHWYEGAGEAEYLPGRDDSLMIEADRLHDALKNIRSANLDVLEPDFAVAIDDCAREVRLWSGWHSLLLGRPLEGIPFDVYTTAAQCCKPASHRLNPRESNHVAVPAFCDTYRGRLVSGSGR